MIPITIPALPIVVINQKLWVVKRPVKAFEAWSRSIPSLSKVKDCLQLLPSTYSISLPSLPLGCLPPALLGGKKPQNHRALRPLATPWEAAFVLIILHSDTPDNPCSTAPTDLSHLLSPVAAEICPALCTTKPLCRKPAKESPFVPRW